MQRRTLILSTVIAISLLTFIYIEWRRTSVKLSPLDELTQNFENIPTELAGWESQPSVVSKKEFEVTRCTAHESRTFLRGNKKIDVYVKCGTARHVSIRTPAGYTRPGIEVTTPEWKSVPLGEGSADFGATTFVRTHPGNEARIRTYLAYSDDGNWVWPQSWGGAKVHFSGQPALAAVYFSVHLAEDDDVALADEIITELTKDYLPRLSKALFPGMDQSIAPGDD